MFSQEKPKPEGFCPEQAQQEELGSGPLFLPELSSDNRNTKKIANRLKIGGEGWGEECKKCECGKKNGCGVNCA